MFKRLMFDKNAHFKILEIQNLKKSYTFATKEMYDGKEFSDS